MSRVCPGSLSAAAQAAASVSWACWTSFQVSERSSQRCTFQYAAKRTVPVRRPVLVGSESRPAAWRFRGWGLVCVIPPLWAYVTLGANSPRPARRPFWRRHWHWWRIVREQRPWLYQDCRCGLRRIRRDSTRPGADPDRQWIATGRFSTQVRRTARAAGEDEPTTADMPAVPPPTALLRRQPPPPPPPRSSLQPRWDAQFRHRPSDSGQ